MEIYSDPVSYFVADFFGSPSMNLIAGEIVTQAAGRTPLRGALRLQLPERFKRSRRAR